MESLFVPTILLILINTCISLEVRRARIVRDNDDGLPLELSTFPPGPIHEGSTVTIKCRAPGGKQPFDILRLVRQVDGRLYEITTNNLLSEAFQRTGRYKVTHWNDDQGSVNLQVEHIRGVDGGHIGCQLLTVTNPRYTDVFFDLIVNVPPRRVEILHHSQGSDIYRANEAELLHLPQGVQTTVWCRVTTTDTDFEPDVSLTLDGQEVTSRFTKNSTTIADDATSSLAMSQTGFARFTGRTFEFQLLIDSAGSNLASLVHGKNLTCSATLPHFNPVTASVRLEIAYRPQVHCESEYGGQLGEVNFVVTCSGRSHPSPHQVVWSWTLPLTDAEKSVIDAEKRVEIFNGNINMPDLQPFYSSEYSNTGDAQYEFRFRVAELQSQDFRQYELEVSNEVGKVLLPFRISQVYASTPKRLPTSKTHSPAESAGDQPAEPWKSVSAANCLSSSVCNMLSLLSVITCHIVYHVQITRRLALPM